MTNDADQAMANVIALQDQDGHLYLIARAVAELGRVPEDQVATLTNLLNDSGDVSGFMVNSEIAQTLANFHHNNAPDTNQLSPADLAALLQQQQRTLHAMSNIIKQQHDTMMNMIRRIGG